MKNEMKDSDFAKVIEACAKKIADYPDEFMGSNLVAKVCRELHGAIRALTPAACGIEVQEQDDRSKLADRLDSELRLAIDSHNPLIRLPEEDWQTVIAALRSQSADSAVAVAWIEHHKGGDNLNWERVDHSYAKATPLCHCAAPAPAKDFVMVSRTLLMRLREYTGMVRSNDVSGDDPIYGVMDDVDSILAASQQSDGKENSNGD